MPLPNETELNRLRLELAELEREWNTGRYLSPAIRAQMRPCSIAAFFALFAAPACILLQKLSQKMFFIWLAIAFLVLLLILAFRILWLRTHKANGAYYVQERQSLVHKINQLDKTNRDYAE